MEKYTVKTASAEETEAIGADLAARLLKDSPGELYFIMLRGELGAGKTAFCRGFVSVLSPGSRVKSPSYTIVNEYRMGCVPVFHFDLYRLGKNACLDDIGFDDYVSSGHCIMEWSEYFGDTLPHGVITVVINKKADLTRTITVN